MAPPLNTWEFLGNVLCLHKRKSNASFRNKAFVRAITILFYLTISHFITLYWFFFLLTAGINVTLDKLRFYFYFLEIKSYQLYGWLLCFNNTSTISLWKSPEFLCVLLQCFFPTTGFPLDFQWGHLKCLILYSQEYNSSSNKMQCMKISELAQSCDHMAAEVTASSVGPVQTRSPNIRRNLPSVRAYEDQPEFLVTSVCCLKHICILLRGL